MRKFILPVALGMSLLVAGQNKINLIGLQKLSEINSEVRSRGAESPRVEAIVTMTDGWTDDVFAKYDAKLVLEVTDNILVVEVAADRMLEFANDDEVSYVEYGREFQAMLDYARPASAVTDVQNGFDYDGSTVSFTGKGVITGLMDQGVDPNHVNFTDDKGASRVKSVYFYKGATESSYTSPVRIRQCTTDDETATHGTHVAGIMAGAYKGDGDCAYSSATTIPYYGVATGSNLVMAAGAFSNTNIIKGVKHIIEDAKSFGMPAVVNLSLGSNNGPHDGSGSLERALSALTSDAVICVSAGNEGDSKIFVGKKFTSTVTELKTFVASNISGGIDVWTNSSEPVTVAVAMYATGTGKLTEVAKVSAAGQMASCGGSFATSMQGSCTLSAEVNPLNKRYHVSLNGAFTPKAAGNNVALIISGKEGQQVYVYGYSAYQDIPETQFASNRVQGFTDGTTDGSISDLACAEGVIAVGSYTTRTSWPTYAGTYKYSGGNFVVGDVSPFSSYGTTYQGEDLPHVCAPGANILSSLNRYYIKYVKEHPALGINVNSSTSAKVDATLPSYWGPMQGTSMSCPYTAGTVALWLEADPTLDVNDVKDIIKATSESPTGGGSVLPGLPGSSSDKKWGAGKLDALEGVKEVLKRKALGGIDGVIADNDDRFVINPVGRGVYNVVVDGAGMVNATLYNMQGVAVANAKAQGNEVTVEAQGAAAGVYVLAVETPNTSRISRRVVIR